MPNIPIASEPTAVRPSFGPATERRVGARIGWSAIFSGVSVAAGVWLMLHVLGLGLGLTSIDPDDAGSLRGAGIGAGVWSLIAPILALFVGGAVAGRVAGVLDRQLSALHGCVVWALTSIVGVMVLVSTISSMVGTSARFAGDAVRGAGGLAAHGAEALDGRAGGVIDALGLTGEELIAPINRELREQGKPPVTTDQMRAIGRDVAATAVRSGELDRRALIASIAGNTQLSEAQAADLADQLERRWEARKRELAGVADQAKAGALSVAESAGKGLLIAFGSLALSLIAAAGGALAGTALWRRQVLGPRERAAG